MGQMRRLDTPLLVAVLLGTVFGGPARAALLDSNLAVAPATQANGGGCYPVSISPGLLDMLMLINPEWAPVDVGSHLPPASDPITVHGTVVLSKVNETGDFPGDHLSDDQNTFVTVDSADMGFVATGNVGPEGVEAGNIEVEREIGAYPLFAWAGEGDRLTGSGRWIWDCGHPLQDPAGTCSVTMTQSCVLDSDCAPPVCPSCLPSGETCVGVNFNYHSELHPPHAVAVSRVGRGYAFTRKVKGGRPATRTDVWISAASGGAGDACLVTHQASPLSLLSLNCYPLSQPLFSVNASDFAFDIPLPPRPAGNTRPPRVKVVDQTPRGLPRPKVTTTFVDGPSPVVHAVVDLTTPVHGRLPSAVGKTIIAGWLHDPTPVTRLRVEVTGIEILNPLKAVTPAVPLTKRCSVTTSQDCSVTPCPTGETCLSLGGPTPGWQVWLEVDGDWQALSGLGTVAAPGTAAQKLTYDVALPAGAQLHLHATGKSLACEESQLYGQSIARDLALYGLTNGALCLADMSHDIGALDVTYGGPDFGSGAGSMTYATQSVGGEGGTCSTTMSQLCIKDADCPMGETCVVTGGSYKLHYTITRR
ncbi:MAG TPA: hypothetical protein VKW76_13850 [Candidatus Binatia bacterium]|nr:hypothetical protein [Candidatus Binatia bacterium]